MWTDQRRVRASLVRRGRARSETGRDGIATATTFRSNESSLHVLFYAEGASSRRHLDSTSERRSPTSTSSYVRLTRRVPPDKRSYSQRCPSPHVSSPYRRSFPRRGIPP